MRASCEKVQETRCIGEPHLLSTSLEAVVLLGFLLRHCFIGLELGRGNACSGTAMAPTVKARAGP